jgi:hypothetical protein
MRNHEETTNENMRRLNRESDSGSLGRADMGANSKGQEPLAPREIPIGDKIKILHRKMPAHN